MTLGENAHPVTFDVSDSSSSLSEITSFSRKFGGLDAVVHCAGVMNDSSLNLVSQDLLENVFRTNVYGSFFVLQAAIRLMARKRSGSIVLLGSVVGEDGAMGQSVYSASKGAVTSLVKSAAKEVAPLKIRVNGVAPGPIDTGLLDVFTIEQKEDIVKRIPLGRIGETKDVAKLIEFLCSDDSSFLTGQMIRVDGGFKP